MPRSLINDIVSEAPVHDGRISFARLDGTETLTLAELYERAGRVASGLRRMGVAPGDRIGILAANGLEWVLLDLAALRLKAETAGFEPGKFEPDAELLARYDIKLLFSDRPSDAPPASCRSPTSGCSPRSRTTTSRCSRSTTGPRTPPR
ncbi:hypothetical protein GCM10020000_38460 [Streptomyces olivoverticillatus]